MSRSRRKKAQNWFGREKPEVRRRLTREFRHRVRVLVRRDPEGALPLPPRTSGWESW